MWVIYVEMGVAVAMMILIIWWTLPAKRPESKEKETRPPGAGDGKEGQ